MEIFQVDEQQNLFISPEIDDWDPVTALGITAVIDLDGTTDLGVPAVPNQMLYVFFPFEDCPELPDLQKLHEVARLGAALVNLGTKVLVHCGMGHNRCALVSGVMLTYMGLSGTEAVTLLRSKRQGALYNRQFAGYIESLSNTAVPSAS
jgi:protein-tyrosine phosphatase